MLIETNAALRSVQKADYCREDAYVQGVDGQNLAGAVTDVFGGEGLQVRLDRH